MGVGAGALVDRASGRVKAESGGAGADFETEADRGWGGGALVERGSAASDGIGPEADRCSRKPSGGALN